MWIHSHSRKYIQDISVTMDMQCVHSADCCKLHVCHQDSSYQGCSAAMAKRPDVVPTPMVPWKAGKFLVWEATCVDPCPPSYRSLAVRAAGDVAARAETLKEDKYHDLQPLECFHPHGGEIGWCFWPHTLGRRVRQQTGEEKAHTYPIQRLSMGIPSSIHCQLPMSMKKWMYIKHNSSLWLSVEIEHTYYILPYYVQPFLVIGDFGCNRQY